MCRYKRPDLSALHHRAWACAGGDNRPQFAFDSAFLRTGAWAGTSGQAFQPFTTAHGRAQVATIDLNSPSTRPSCALGRVLENLASTFLPSTIAHGRIQVAINTIFARGCVRVATNNVSTFEHGCAQVAEVNDLEIQGNTCSDVYARTASVSLLCMPMCTWLSIATSLLIFTYESSALLGVGATVTRVCGLLLAGACGLCARGSGTAAPHGCVSILKCVVTHVCTRISRALSRMRATVVCVHSMQLSVSLLCMPMCTWLYIATSLLISTYESGALLRVGVTVTRVCGLLLAGACGLCARGSATASQHTVILAWIQTLNCLAHSIVAYMCAVLLQIIVFGMSTYYSLLYTTAHALCISFSTMADVHFSCFAHNPTGRFQTVLARSQPVIVP